MRTYLKSHKYGSTYEMYNHKTMTRCRIYRGNECDIEEFEDMADFAWSLSYSLQKEEMEESDADEFNEALEEFTRRFIKINKG